MPGVSPTAWVYFAYDRDPLRDTIGDAFQVFLPAIRA